jgi:hypothetical protein
MIDKYPSGINALNSRLNVKKIKILLAILIIFSVKTIIDFFKN